MLINFNVFEFLLVATLFAAFAAIVGIGATLISDEITGYLSNHSKNQG